MSVKPMPEKQAQLEKILEHAADKLGDINPAILELYYSRYPEAKQMFEDHGCGYVGRLEASMLESALYCLMVWYERPMEIEVIIEEAVPHHELLNIPVSFFSGLEEAAIDVIDMALDDTDTESKSLLVDLKNNLISLIQR